MSGLGLGFGVPDLAALAERLVAVGGVVGVLLGGSRARGTHHPDSDVDLGVYYRPPLDVDGLAALAREVAGPDATVTRPGDWGPWVDGGAWLSVDGVAVDWVYRDVDRVQTAWRDAQDGPGRVAGAGRAPAGRARRLVRGRGGARRGAGRPDRRAHPPAHRGRAVPGGARGDARRAAAGGRVHRWPSRARPSTAATSPTSRAACSARSGCARYALHAHARRWVVNEKGLIAAAGALPGAPAGFAARAHGLLARVGSTPDELAATLDAAAALVAEVERAVGAPPPPVIRPTTPERSA